MSPARAYLRSKYGPQAHFSVPTHIFVQFEVLMSIICTNMSAKRSD